eukprot:11677766-Heterocapsa_arctica.AAC.1
MSIAPRFELNRNACRGLEASREHPGKTTAAYSPSNAPGNLPGVAVMHQQLISKVRISSNEEAHLLLKDVAGDSGLP